LACCYRIADGARVGVRYMKRPPARQCAICGRTFRPKAYAWRQRVCSWKRCQAQRRSANYREWLRRNPDYFNGHPDQDAAWLAKRRDAKALWRAKNRDYMKNWRARNKERIREYMRRWRVEQRRAGVGKTKLTGGR
jgi:hypothetical protein